MELSDLEVFTLPGGYVDDDGTVHREFELSQMTGDEEYLLSGLSPQTPRAEFITRLLALCVKRIGSFGTVDETLAGHLLVGDRDYIVLKLREALFGERMERILRCPAPDCGKLMNLAFNTDSFDFAGAHITQRTFTVEPDASDGAGHSTATSPAFEFRLPTGRDQEICAREFSSDPETAVGKLLARCLQRVGERTEIDDAFVNELPPAALSRIEERMSELAPRVEIELEAHCPECETSFETVFDLATHVLDELRGSFRNLEREVHFLALHYHWSERDILSMTRRRRRRYVALLQEELDRAQQVW
ncbi:MAG: hypothetical protein WCD76_08730 [Pyrinomonadaceae bacterium]